MFTGIVQRTGLVRDVQDLEGTRRFRVEAGSLTQELAPGDSVSVDGACLTVTDVRGDGFLVDVIGTTLDRTIAGSYADGSRVNLERALRAGDGLDGHLVQGHVDGVGTLERSVKDGAYWLMDFEVPPDVHATTIEHGSITLNGVSLTVSELRTGNGVRIGVIPYTHEHTNLGELRPGDRVNVEADLVGKYVARVLAQRTSEELR
jgi:riboflavin synthase